MNFDRIHHIQTVMAKVEPLEVGLNYYMDPTAECGTIACIAGWCALDEKFREQGLTMHRHHMVPQYRHDAGLEALAQFFDLPPDQAENLFGARWASDYDNEISHLEPTDHELAMHRIKRFLEDHDPDHQPTA